MKLFFYPAITLMNRLVYPKKFTLLGLMLFIAIAILAGSLFVSLDMVIRTSQRQLESISLIKPISRTVQLIQQHRGLSAMLPGGKEVVRDRRAAKEQEVTEAFNALEEKLPADMRSTPDWQDIREHWGSLRKEGLNWTAAKNFAAHTRLIDQILLFEVVHTQSTDVDMFYLVDIALNRLPDVLEHMGRIRAYCTGVLAEKRITEAQKKNIHGMIANLNDALPPLKISFDKAAYHNPMLRSSLSTASGDISNSVTQIVNLVESDILTGRFSTSPEDFMVMATTAIDDSYSHMYESLLPATEALIRKRIAQAEKVLRISVGIAFLLFLAVAYFSVGIYYAIIGSIQALARSARAFATGDMRERIDLGTHDELKQVGDSFNEMADGFNALLEAHREDEERLRATIETAMDAVVQINAEGTIIGWTTQAENIFGWTRSEAIGQALHKTIIPSQYSEAHIRGLERFLASGEGNILNSRLELLGLHRDGHEFPIELSVAPIKTAEGYEFSAFIRDITGRKLLEEELKYSESRFRALMEQSPLSIQIFTPDGRTKSVNLAWENMWGITLEALAQYNVLQDKQLIAKGVMPYIKKAFAGEATEIPSVFYDMDANKEVAGSRRKFWVRAFIYPLKNAAGDIQEIALIHEDITEQHLAAEQLRIAAATFETQEAILIADADANILRVNHAFEALSGYSEAEIIGQNPRILQSGRHDKSFYQAMWSQLRDTGNWSGEIWDRHKNGEIYPKKMTITAVYDEHHQLTHYVAVSSDISQRKQAEEDAYQLAFFDPLTKLPNRRLLLDRLQQAIAVSTRSSRHGALLFLDLDHFKTINDTQGHAMGDLLLIEVARRLQSCVREGDSVARLGGDEFVVVLEELSSEPDEAATQTELVAEKIRNELDQPYMLRNYQCHTTPSIGISLFLGHLENVEDLLKHADIAMYQAKTAGRNAIRFFDPQMQKGLDMRAALETDLRQALAKLQFCLYYQVQVDHRGKATGAEVLLRWKHPERGFVFPDQFIPLTEETGLIVPIGLWVLETACTQLKAWQHNALTRDLTLAVNVSAKQFRQADFVAQVQRVLLASGAKPSLLKLELTESTVLESIDDATAKMHEIKMLGVSFSMDDFGTGHSSLQYLKRLPLDQIKIDRSFVLDIPADPSDAAIVQAIIAMTKALGLNVIAEGVETEVQRDFLAKYGCHAYQGYLFSKPVPLEEFEALLKQG